jgi:sorbitol/mannitol transport system substrate-binding protein
MLMYRKDLFDEKGLTMPEQPTYDIGVQFVGIPEFQSIGTQVGQNISATLAGKMSVGEALKASQAEAQRAVKQGGYLK